MFSQEKYPNENNNVEKQGSRPYLWLLIKLSPGTGSLLSFF
jgi:hypothetical protein